MRALFLFAAILLTGCSTQPTIEHNVTASAPLSIGSSPNMGFLYKTRGPDGKVVSTSFNSDGYQWVDYLFTRYGANLKPPRESGFGLTKTVSTTTLVARSGAKVNAGDTIYTLNREASDDLTLMADWSRSDEHPKKTLLQNIGL